MILTWSVATEVPRYFKDYYRPQLLNLIYSQPTSELRYTKMREIAENLDVQGQGYFSEDWYQKAFTPRLDGSGKQIPNTTQVTLDVETAKSNYNIDLDTKNERRFDEFYGDENDATIREHKHVSKQLQGEQIKQFQDNIKIVLHNRSIDAKLANGKKLDGNPKDTPVIIESKDGNKFRPKRVVYTFATPEGVKANRKLMIDQLQANSKYLSFELINSKGEIKIINISNIKELSEPILSRWLYPTPTNNSINNP